MTLTHSHSLTDHDDVLLQREIRSPLLGRTDGRGRTFIPAPPSPSHSLNTPQHLRGVQLSLLTRKQCEVRLI